jgi:membrane protease subunit HflC
VQKLPSTRQFWGDDAKFSLPDLPTRDDKKIEVIPWAIWRIREPTVFLQRMRTMELGEKRLADFVRGAIRDTITQYDLTELVRSSDRLNTAAPIEKAEDVREGAPRTEVIRIKFGRKKILDQIKDEVHRRLASAGEDGGGRGIELIDVGISQIEFVPSVQQKTFDRWVAERQAISARNVNEGERLKQEILNRTAAEVQKIEGEGQQKANETRGTVDAEVIRKYAQAIEEAGEFYTFVRTLEAYKTAINGDTRLILTTDSDFLRMLKGLEPAPAAKPAAGTSPNR